jgi:hypothetical protein
VTVAYPAVLNSITPAAASAGVQLTVDATLNVIDKNGAPQLVWVNQSVRRRYALFGPLLERTDEKDLHRVGGQGDQNPRSHYDRNWEG